MTTSDKTASPRSPRTPFRLDPGTPDRVNFAATLAVNGLPVLPIRIGTKHPTHPADDPETAPPNHARWWLRTPIDVLRAHEDGDESGNHASVQYAAAHGQPNADGIALVGFDVDGDPDALAATLAEAGPDAQEWAASTLGVHRGEPGRRHVWGLWDVAEHGPVPETRHLTAGLEWRGSTGYTLLPGARHPSGQFYRMTADTPTTTTAGPPPSGEGEGVWLFAGWAFDDRDRLVGVQWVRVLPMPAALVEVIKARHATADTAQTASARADEKGRGGTTTEDAGRFLDEQRRRREAAAGAAGGAQDDADDAEAATGAQRASAPRSRPGGDGADGLSDPTDRARAKAYAASVLDGLRGDLIAARWWPAGHRDDLRRGWERLIADGAYRLARLALADWSGVTMDEAKDALVGAAPRGGYITDAWIEKKWAQQLRRACRTGPLELPEPEDTITDEERAMARAFFAAFGFGTGTGDSDDDLDDGNSDDTGAMGSQRGGAARGSDSGTDGTTADNSTGEADPSGQGSTDDDGLWRVSDQLRMLHGWALARRASPEAVLAVSLARVLMTVPQHVRLDTGTDSPGSLNVLLALVGKSGQGKGRAERTAGDALLLPGDPVHRANLGSGEGITRQYRSWVKKKGMAGYWAWDRRAVLFTETEVQNLNALTSRQGTTLDGQIRKAFMGEALGFAYAAEEKRATLPDHSYRFGLVLGLQPEHGKLMLSKDQTAGGTPQRYVWAWTDYAGHLHARPECPEPVRVAAQSWARPAGSDWVFAQVCARARDEIDAADYARATGATGALDGHAVFVRAKLAFALAVLHGRQEVTEWDWDVSALVMARSDRTRAEVGREIATDERKGRTAAQRARSEEAVAVDLALHRSRVEQAKGAIRRALARGGGSAARKAMKDACGARLRDCLDEALDALESAGEVRRDGARWVING